MSTKSTKTVTLTIKVTPEEKQKVKEIAARANSTVSKLLYNFLFKEQKFLDKED